jgi:hypothetical protein
VCVFVLCDRKRKTLQTVSQRGIREISTNDSLEIFDDNGILIVLETFWNRTDGSGVAIKDNDGPNLVA